jgi:hypothetical protein
VAATRGGLARFVPALSWVPGYQLSWLSKDAIAGFTIWGLLIPEGIADLPDPRVRRQLGAI